MPRRPKYLYVCPDCSATTFTPKCFGVSRKFRDTTSLVDGQQYPSCRRVEQLCMVCVGKRWDVENETCMNIPTPRSNGSDQPGSRSSVPTPGLLGPFLELLAFLAGSGSETGDSRQPGTISLKLVSGVWGLTLNDAETSQYCFLEGRSLDDLLLKTEIGLGDGGLPWRPSSYTPKKKR